MIVALLNQLGGVGKTTLALHLAGVWACQGQSVIVIDADPQGSALDWSEQRAEEGLPRRFAVIGFARDTLHREALKIARVIDRVIVDGPSHIAALTRAALLAADLVIIPTQPPPSPPFDLLALAETLRLVKQASVVRPQLRTYLALNRCDVSNVAAREMAQTLPDGPPGLTSRIGQRDVFAEAAPAGRLVFELPHSTAAVCEITALAAEVERVAR